MSSCGSKSIIGPCSKLKLPSSTTSKTWSDKLSDDTTTTNTTPASASSSTAAGAAVEKTTADNNEEDAKDCQTSSLVVRAQSKASGVFICPRTYYVSSDHSYSRYNNNNNCKQQRSSCSGSESARNEYRMARGGISGDRGRGGGGGGGAGAGGGGATRPRAFKNKSASERDSNADGYSRPKFQESLKNHENKYYDDKRTNEDSRISKLLRRLCREDDYDHFLTLCKQLQEGISAPENQRYIRRNLDNICDSLLDLLYNGPSQEAKSHVAKCLGRVGYVADQDFKRYMDWVFNKYTSALEYKDSNNIKCLLMKSFNETLKLDSETPKLKEHSMTIMSQLQSALENVDRPDLLVSTVDPILLTIDSYPDSFVGHFRNTVDILVGWHIDSIRQKSVVMYASRSLQRLRRFWIADLPFTLTLLGQFLEDMENYDEELSLPNSGRSSPGSGGGDGTGEPDEATPCPRDCLLRITSVVAVFNTVMRCIEEHLSPNLTPSVQWSFLMDCLSKMLKMVVKAVELDDDVEIQMNSCNDVGDGGLSKENIDSITRSMKSINISQKNIDTLLRNLNKDDEMSEESLVRMIKYLNLKKNDKKNCCKSSDKDGGFLTLSKEKEESLINLIKSMDLRTKRNSDLSEEKEELIVVANECLCLLLGHLQSRVSKSHELLYKFIDLQLQRVSIFWDETIVSMLRTISKVIKEVSANLPLELVHTLLGKNSVLAKLRFRSTVLIQNAVLGVYHSLLSLKNIPLLQEAYRYILADLENAFNTVISISDEPLVSDNPFVDVRYERRHAEIVIVFLLRALSDIANASNSIIGMWALKPSILELLAVKLKPHNSILAAESPLLQYHILFLLYAHCSRYNHFVPSSSLITGSSSCRPLDIFPGTLEVPTVSPTSGHLSIILNLIARSIDSKKTPYRTTLLLLDWIHEIYAQAENYIGVLSKTDVCRAVVSSLLVCGASTNHKISVAVCKNLECLIRAKQVSWPDKVYSSIVDLAILHLTSFHKTVREDYGRLLMNVPLNVVLPKLNRAGLLADYKKFKDVQNYSSEALVLSQRLHMRSNNGEMQAQHFKTYMAFLLQEKYFDSRGLSEIFTLSWPTICDSATMSKMYELGLSNLSFLYFWGGFEAAQHCVLNKLRTPLGKPQETFTTIEAALKQLAREIAACPNETAPSTSNKNNNNNNSSKIKDPGQLLHEHTRVRLLVEFLEHLERVIHNASEGCAVALLPHSKPVRTFFHTNRSTCREWLNRIRLALCVVSLHSGLATNALRNGQRLLEDLSAANNTQGPEFERATLCTARALVMLGEAEALQGLYVYTKERDRKFVWLKAVMEEAAEKYELAADNYRQIIEDKILARPSEEADNGEIRPKNDLEDTQVAAFCMERLSKCYYSLGAWKELENWKHRESEILEQEKNPSLRKQMFETISAQQATCLRKLDEGEELALKELSNWNLLDEQARTSWSCTKTMTECTNTLTNIALRLHLDDSQRSASSFQEDIEKCHRVAAKTMEEALRNLPSEYLDSAIISQYSAAGLVDILSNSTRSQASVFELSEMDKPSQLSSSVLTQVLWWSDYFRRADRMTGSPDSKVDALRLQVARSARKEGNFGLAQRELGKYFESGLGSRSNVFGDIVEDIVNGLSVANEVDWTKDNMRAFRETSKLLRDMEKADEALKVCSITALGISRSIVTAGEQAPPELREVGTRVLLTLGKWIQQDARVDNNPQLDELLCFESLHNDGLMDKLFGKTTELIPPADVIVGKVVQLGVNQCPDLPAAWSSFAGWCYKWGRKIVDNSNSGLLTDIDKTNIQSLLPMDINDSDFNTVLTILGQKNRVVPEDEGDIDTNDVNTSETIENLLRGVPILSCASSEHLGMLVDIWRQAQSRIYAYYELSANAYFKYLQLAKDENDCETITATLRLLRLVVKHASELQNVLESGLSSTPTGPWKEIIPQLFSRLSHPECYVRTRVSELLCRIAENSPHLITFPAVVGAVSSSQKNYEGATAAYEKNGNSDEGPNEVDYFMVDEHDYGAQDANQGFMDVCFAQLTDCLSNRIPDSVDQVKILVRELRRITLLWDELWLATLCQHHSEITKRFEQLELEVQKVQDNIWLTPDEKEKLVAEKHRIILKPIVFILENLLAMTSVPAETPHEKSFQEKFGPSIEKVIDKMKNPKNPSRPQSAALPLKQLESKLAQKVHKRAYTLSMSDISPTLAKFQDTCIAMPGICSTKMVTIKSVDNHVQILPTKTKPKKLIFRGSDGQVYTYLFKGLEDLHLDERIMQFLSICNTMMSKSSDDEDCSAGFGKKVYRARHYSVIPLGPRSGLIQWVDGVTPLFALYKRWQQRESAMSNNKSSGSAVLRPSELFYSKLTPLLKERGIPTDNRKEWPLPVLKQVLAELMAETPKDLLAKEIWCNSINAGSWWQATKNYSYSVAVMSIIGYIIGLGDRHLDNVLVDLNSGEVVHIDYNVCFEKGKTLRVPEKVPFRMTSNIKTALGVTGVEGIFRLACEHTLRVMRRGRETLLTLLEAFVYDPLVDWRAGAEGNTLATYGACQARARCTGSGRKQLELELTAAMFAVRIAEMRAEWLANKEELAKSFPALCHRLNRWIEACEASRQCQESLQDRHRQLALVKEAQAMGRNHALYSVAKRYNAFKRAKDVLEKAKLGLKERIEDCQKQINTHNMALSAVRGPQLGIWLSELGGQTIQEDHLVFDLVKEFLQNAGQSQMIVQCEQSENELTQLAVQQSMFVRNCLDLLSQYSAICNLYPLSHITQHRSVAYHGWANKLLHSGTVESCHEVLAQLEAHFAPVTANNPKVQRTVAFSYQIQAILGEANDKLTKAYERMISEGLPEAAPRIEKAYAESIAQITTFLRREKGADKALECVNISLLCSLNKKYLMMEGAAKCAGDCLVDLTSREGDWFLDEMRLMSSLMVELVSLIPENHKSNNEPKISLIAKCLRSADNIHKGLQELNYNFHTIILPEATKTIITEEPTVMQMINELDEIIASTGLSLMEIEQQLEMQMRFTIMEMERPHTIMQSVVDTLRVRFEALLSKPSDLQQEINQEETLTPGQMLLMGFNGLFEKLQMEGNALVSTLCSFEIPASWKKIDQIREAKDMSAAMFNELARKVLEDVFLVKRLHTIQKFFSMCRDIAYAYRAESASIYEGGLSGIYSDEQLNKPIRSFTADYVSRQLIGLTSQCLGIALCYLLQRLGLNVATEIEQRDVGAESKVSLEELCRKLVDMGLKRGLFSGSVFNQASTLSGALETSWRRKQSAKATQQAVDLARATVQRLQLQLTAHYWLHEDYLIIGSNMNLINPLNRSSFMLELRKTSAGLSNLQIRVNEAREQQQNLVQSAVQRLKWAAGANPALSEVMAAFDNAVLTSCDKLARTANLAALVVNTCNTILHYEALRTRTQEGLANDANFVKLVKRWEESCLLTMNMTITVSPVEESLIELLHNSPQTANPSDNCIDANWLRQTEKLISDAIIEAQKKSQERQESLIGSQQALREQLVMLQSVIAEHHRLMNDVRMLLRSMAKQENIVGLQEFLMKYRSCTENLSATIKELESDNLDPMKAAILRMELEMLAVKTPALYDELLSFADGSCNSGSVEVNCGTEREFNAFHRAKFIRQDSVCLSPRKGVTPVRDPTTGKAVQERNAYALNVWRRVRMKLEGRDPNPGRKYTTSEQVEYVIREAQSTENLALLYEGWTPWV